MSSQTEEIKARIDIVDLISEYIKVKQAGTNWRALCPFHNEKTPSFMISKEKQIWHCFGCGEGGDIFSFVQKMEGVDFPEALKILANKAGVKLVTQDPKLISQKNRLLDISQLATNYWHKVLLESPAAQKARDYLDQRKVSQDIIKEFKIGYAVESWDNLIRVLKNRDFNDQEIFLAGLSVKKERGHDFYDRFRDRLIFPINDMHGNPIGFSGRTLKKDEKAGKYINTPQTLIYNKSLVIFNLDKAKQEIKKKDFAILAEGQMDVIAAVQAGTQNIIASSGTALTLDQLSIIKRYTKNLAIAFDTDLAGESAAKRGIDLALSQDLNVKIIVLPEGKDPDECIKNNPDDWFKSIKDAKSIMEYYFDKTFSKLDLNKVEDKKEAAKILLPVISKIGNTIEQTHWLQKLASKLNVTEQILRESLVGGSNSVKTKQSNQELLVKKDRGLMLLEQIFAIVLKYPENLPYLVDNFLPDLIQEEKIKTLYKKLIIYYTEDIGNNIKDFDYQLFKFKLKEENIDALADQFVLLAEKDFFDFDSESIKNELIKAVNFYKKSYYSSRLRDIEGQLKQSEDAKDNDRTNKLTEEFGEVLNELKFLD